MISKDSPKCTCSPESAGGPMQPDLLAGLTTGPSGPVHARASRSRSREKGKVPLMSGTYGPTFIDSSALAVPWSLWESRLAARLAMLGSTECDLIWRRKVTPAKRPIFRLAPSERRTSDSDCTGLLPSPGASDWKRSSRWGQRRGQLNEVTENCPIWMLIATDPVTEGKLCLCTIHGMLVAECPCPSVDEWDIDPYSQPSLGYSHNPALAAWLMGFPAE